ncbi:hypothetical protein E2C01_072586 [Portunus trituberculatus]|uniref:Uncharacterized protein n=1 Tax=Portunus trituberculatus TaxID=210409 RepID=A0A5B7IB51_PORTR|nr:hypothetical protein [Portunus trituberculatus]
MLENVALIPELLRIFVPCKRGDNLTPSSSSTTTTTTASRHATRDDAWTSHPVTRFTATGQRPASGAAEVCQPTDAAPPHHPLASPNALTSPR